MDLSALTGAGAGAGAGVYPESLDSSPRSRTDFDSDPAPKIRLMCSFGGRIVPRPTDKSLCYLGGDTRMVSIDRHASLSDLIPRLSRSLLSSRPFLLKYQLPHEDLDSLISISTDEDLENLIDEYDRLSNSGSAKSARIRLFLFPIKSESAPSSINTISSLLDDSKSETWFVDALNGALIDRGMSADVNSLLGLEDMRVETKMLVPESPMLDTTSSFGSASSGAYLTNLPPIKVREERVEEVGVVGGVTAGQEMLNEMGFAQREAVAVVGRNVNVSPTGDGVREMVSDEERAEQGGARKQQPSPPQQQMQPPQQQMQQPQQQMQQPKAEAPIGDPVTRPIYYQDKPSTATIQAVAAPVPSPAPVATPAAVTTAAATDPSYRGYLLPEQIQYQQQQQQLQHQQQQHQQQQHQQQQHQQQQYTHYIHPGTGAVLPVPSYYQMPQAIPQPHHYDPQMQMYYMPVRPNAPYNLAPIQPSIGDAPVAAAATATTAIPNSAAMPVVTVPKVPIRAELPVNPASLYRAPAQAPQLIHVTPDQAQAYANMGYQIVHQNRPHYPSQTATAMGNYGYEYAADPSHTQQVYYGQTTSPQALAPQYQSMASPAVSVIPDVALAPQPQLQTQARS